MNKFRSKQAKENQIPIILIGSGLLGLIIIFFFIFFSGDSDEEYVKDRFLKLRDLEERVVQLEENVKDMELLVNRIDALEDSLRTRLEDVGKKTDTLKKNEPVASRPARKSIPVKTPKRTNIPVKTPKKTKKPQYHQVNPGETLYSISRRYRLSVDELRRINKLAPGASIHPGQKLRINER